MNRPHFFYKAWHESEVAKQLQAFTDKCNEVSETARLWAEKQGATSYIESPDGMAGGIAALEIENCISKEGFERVVMPNGNVIFMPEPDSDLEKEMYALPIVSEAELINILGMKPRVNSKGQSLPITFGDTTPIVFLHHGFWYVDVPYECEKEGLERIAEKEFYRRHFAAINES